MDQEHTPAPPGSDGWTETSVPLSGIEAELGKLWNSASQEARRSSRAAAASPDGATAQSVSAQGIARARVLNLVAFAGGNAQGPASGEDPVAVVDRVLATHPFRTILIVADESAGDTSITASVKVRARDGADGRKILHETVRIDAHGPLSDGLPSIVLPLLLPDLPTYLWWPGDPPIGHAFWRQMVDACDRLILDSGAFSTPRLSLSQYAQFMETARRYHTFGDLSWTQLAEWRDLVAQIFDNQACRPCLDTIASVTIEFAGRYWSRHRKAFRPDPAAAFLLSGWLCTRLGWKPGSCEVDDETLQYGLQANGRAITLRLAPHPSSSATSACVESIRMEATSSGGAARFEVVREGDKSVASVTAMVPGAVNASRSVSLAGDDRAALLAKEIDQGGPDPPYEAAVAVAGVLAKQAYDMSRR